MAACFPTRSACKPVSATGEHATIYGLFAQSPDYAVHRIVGGTNPTAHLIWLHTAETEVKRGENKGRRLRHDFIAGQVRSVDLASSSADDTWQGTIRIDPEERDNSRAIAVWITTADGSVLQASGSWTHQVSGD